MSIKSEIEELRKLQENGKPGYACGWTDACGLVLSVVDKAKDRLKCCIIENAIMNNSTCIITASTLENIIEEVFENDARHQHCDSL